ncbi:MAG: hypothetical protein ACP5LN_07540, partial [Thermoproteota archaeon]
STSVRINWTFISPVKYKIKVNSTGPFFLVFTDTYDEGWVAYSNRKVYAHFIANGYANGWMVNNSGSFEVEVKFKPNIMFYYGSTISIISVSLIFSCLIFSLLIRNLTLSRKSKASAS